MILCAIILTSHTDAALERESANAAGKAYWWKYRRKKWKLELAVSGNTRTASDNRSLTFSAPPPRFSGANTTRKHIALHFFGSHLLGVTRKTCSLQQWHVTQFAWLHVTGEENKGEHRRPLASAGWSLLLPWVPESVDSSRPYKKRAQKCPHTHTPHTHNKD